MDFKFEKLTIWQKSKDFNLMIIMVAFKDKIK
jgi:hypothetical protein